jgi:hypothetical protein
MLMVSFSYNKFSLLVFCVDNLLFFQKLSPSLLLDNVDLYLFLTQQFSNANQAISCRVCDFEKCNFGRYVLYLLNFKCTQLYVRYFLVT